MKKTSLLFALLNLCVITLFAQNTPVSATDSLLFENTVHDYDTMAQGADGNYAFVFTNKGSKPITLTNVRASCGCTVAEWPKEPILPGQSNKIGVRYNTNLIGSFNKAITVSSNAANSTVVLRIKGTIVPKS